MLAFTGAQDFVENCQGVRIVGGEGSIESASGESAISARSGFYQVPLEHEEGAGAGATGWRTPSVQRDEVFAEGVQHGFISGVQAELVENVADMILDGVL